MLNIQRKYNDGNESRFIPENEMDDQQKFILKKCEEQHPEFPSMVSPPVSNGFPTGQDHIFHLKLQRLLNDFYGLDPFSEEGVAMIDQLIHSYDISPGEDTIERINAIPMPFHTMAELPIIKYDGWEYCDTEPEPDHRVDDIDLSGIQGALQTFLNEVGEKTKTEPLTLSAYKEKNRLSLNQYKILRTCLNLETRGHHKIEAMRKIWSTVLPESELQKLFHDQDRKFENSH